MEGSKGRGRGNPWFKNPNKKQRPGIPDFNSNREPSKFLEAQSRLQASVQKHLSSKKEYESSSEEEDLESESILGSVLKSYSQLGGKSEDLGRTQNFLEDAFQSGAATCLICIASVKRNEAIWNCEECYCFFHLQCIQRWSKDSIAHQKAAFEDRPTGQPLPSIKWACPKCRHEYSSQEIPDRYYCFCGQKEDPDFHPWLVPHSCGETCNKPLVPSCGHKCLLLCHPGPCPPCPKTVTSSCHCGKSAPRPQRCSNKVWSCGKPCGQTLECNRHKCSDPCHIGSCSPCPQRSKQPCRCGKKVMTRECAQPIWHCEEVCGKPLSCGHHTCEEICHKDECRECPRTQARQCPCGKSTFVLPCTQDVPTCGDTCGRTLDCGVHSCSQRCHKDKCGVCLERSVKQCRCGLHTKEVACQKDYICDTKCKQIKDCNKHPCNRKCCDGACGPCEKPCGRTLLCGNHKCASVCHRGQCYPCPLIERVHCFCGATTIIVPCGRKKKTKPPRCSKLCKIPPDCHHISREPHRCHFGSCPPCRQVCALARETCPHTCPKLCHSAVIVDIHDGMKASGPWEKITPQLELVALPCGNCEEPVSVSCLGSHEITHVPCYRAKSYPCGRICGRNLACGNHSCSLPCHQVEGAPNKQDSGVNCDPCEEPCEFPRPTGCTHTCPKPCHKGDCPPCSAMIRLRCHCTLNQLHLRCGEWTSTDDEGKMKLQTCGNQCPKNYACGHRCSHDCHPGDCPDEKLCRRKVKVTCNCKRIKKDFQCIVVRSGEANIPCDQVCIEKQEEERKKREEEEKNRKIKEELRNREELEIYEKKLQGRKKHRDRRAVENVVKQSFLSRYWIPISCVSILIVSIILIFLLK